jgi:hypothetical protein
MDPRWKVFLGTTSCCGTAWPVSLGFSGLFDDFAFFGVLAVDIAALLDGFRRRFFVVSIEWDYGILPPSSIKGQTGSAVNFNVSKIKLWQNKFNKQLNLIF